MHYYPHFMDKIAEAQELRSYNRFVVDLGSNLRAICLHSLDLNLFFTYIPEGLALP